MHWQVLLTEDYTVCMFEGARPDRGAYVRFPEQAVVRFTKLKRLRLYRQEKTLQIFTF